MKRSYLLLFIFILSSLAFNCLWVGERKSYILYTDMVELYDDGVAMMMLANDESIDLLGVVPVSGNVWVYEATSYALRQLEIMNKPDLPIYVGARHPLMKNGSGISWLTR